MKAILIYMTCATNDEARKIAAVLLDKKLVACANIMPPHTALYSWQGKREESQEVSVILKSRAGLFEAIRAEVVAHHSYDCPCIVALPIEAGHTPFMEWIEAQTGF